MTSSDKKLTNTVGGISARACDNCVRQRARWYCAADDAFLCQSCDSSVHSANPMARRHERARLKTGSMIVSVPNDESRPGDKTFVVPSWHQGVTRKARTPRQKKHTWLCCEDEPVSGISNPPHMVPEICIEECTRWEKDEQLLHRVPVLDLSVEEFCASENVQDNTLIDARILREFGLAPGLVSDEFSHEMDLAEFTADFESLFGKEIEDEWYDMEGLDLSGTDVKENESSWKPSLEIARAVKIEESNHGTDDGFIHTGREAIHQLNLSDSNGEEDNKALVTVPKLMNRNKDDSDIHMSKKILLRLDYNGVMSAWDEQKSPWTTGERPDLKSSGECWPFRLGMCGTIQIVEGDKAGDGGREARVMRYREKRRTRLFAKKIRYQVRKLNAEKRPRIKGRFVKRPNFVLSK